MKSYAPIVVACGFLALFAGCPFATVSPTSVLSTSNDAGRGDASGKSDPSVSSIEKGVDESLAERVAYTITTNQQQRTLSTELHGAWQILHGVLAYGQDFVVQTPSGPERTVDLIRSGRTFSGFLPQLGEQLGTPPRRGIRIELEPVTKVGQGHRDQWLGYLVQSGIGPDVTIRVGDVETTMLDWVNQAKHDTPLNIEQEFSWSLIGLTAYHPTTLRWVARDGNEYSTELLLQSEVERDIAQGACGGTHRLVGISMAVAKRKQERAPITGVWAEAQAKIDLAIALAKTNQNPDGSYSASYLHRAGWARDLGESIGTTGHVLEFLSIAADDETLTQPWVKRTVVKLCDMIDQCEGIELECGALYHALHGLVLYQDRMLKTSSPE